MLASGPGVSHTPAAHTLYGGDIVSRKTAADWRDARVLVTGARGFIGSRLCQKLVDAGAIVQGVSSRSSFDGRSREVSWSAVDLTDLNAVRQMIRVAAPDLVFHLAGCVTGSQALEDVEPTFALNLMSTVHLLTCAAETSRCRVVLAGSMHEPDRDDPDLIPVTPYAASKWASTAYARMFHRLYQYPVAITRPMMVYGPGQWDVTKLLPHVITSLLNGTSPEVSSGKRVLDWVFVDDVVAGMMAVAMTREACGQAIDLGSGKLVSIREIAEMAAALVGSSVPISFGALPERPFERPRVARVKETWQLTGWSAETSLADGLRKTVESWAAAFARRLAALLAGFAGGATGWGLLGDSLPDLATFIA